MFQLAPKSKGVDAGVVIPNFCEAIGGNRPDMGAHELGGVKPPRDAGPPATPFGGGCGGQTGRDGIPLCVLALTLALAAVALRRRRQAPGFPAARDGRAN